jgi:hypothetical protein
MFNAFNTSSLFDACLILSSVLHFGLSEFAADEELSANYTDLRSQLPRASLFTTSLCIIVPSATFSFMMPTGDFKLGC